MFNFGITFRQERDKGHASPAESWMYRIGEGGGGGEGKPITLTPIESLGKLLAATIRAGLVAAAHSREASRLVLRFPGMNLSDNERQVYNETIVRPLQNELAEGGFCPPMTLHTDRLVVEIFEEDEVPK